MLPDGAATLRQISTIRFRNRLVIVTSIDIKDCMCKLTNKTQILSLFSHPQVSLDSRVREGINQSLAEPSNMMYDEAQLQIYTLMHRDSFPRFLNSSVYRDLLASRRRTCLDT